MVPFMEGTVYSLFEIESDQNPLLSPGLFVDPGTAVEESCEEGYYKTTSIRVIICSGNGKWKPKADKLCLSKYLCIIINGVYKHTIENAC